MIAGALFYDVTLGFVDGAYAGAETGSANQPRNTVREGVQLTPLGYPLLLTPGTYSETLPLTFSRPMTVRVARGGAAIIGP
jgi:hypothetical protein